MKVVVFLGPPGSGKGTIAEKLIGLSGCAHISTGAMLRDAIAGATETGGMAKEYMERGELVPDEIMARVVEERIGRCGSEECCILDGFPRTQRQAEVLDSVLARRGENVFKAILLEAPEDVLVQRLSGRRVCRACGRNFHVINVPPRIEGKCDSCGGELYQRADDKVGTIMNRLEVYRRETEDLVRRYEKKGLLARVDSSRAGDVTAAEVAAML